MKTPLTLIALAALVLGAPTLLAAETAEPSKKEKAPAPKKVLGAGDKAPAFLPTAWLQGEPVAAFEDGKVYLIEFWATWCGPCIQQIPHLEALQKKYADQGLVVIGTNVRDKDRATAENFVKKKAKEMTYRVAFDAPKGGQITRDWLEAGQVNGIPHSFVVRDGIILWRGHPGHLNNDVIEQMLAGKFNVTAAAEKQKQAAEANAAEQKARNERYNAARKAAMDAIDAKNVVLAQEKIAAFCAMAPEARRPLERLKLNVRLHTATNNPDKTVAECTEFLEGNTIHTLVLMELITLMSKDPALLADKKGGALLNTLCDKILADPFFGKTPSGILLVAKTRYSLGDKAGALAALEVIEKAQGVPEPLTARVNRIKAAVESGADWPANG